LAAWGLGKSIAEFDRIGETRGEGEKLAARELGKRIAEFDRIGETRGEGENWLQGN